MKKPLEESIERLQDHSVAGPAVELSRDDAPSCPSFEVDEIKRIDARSSLYATFTLHLSGVTISKCLMFVTRTRTFVTGPSTKAPWAKGGYERHVDFEEALASAVLEALEARFSAIEAQDAIQ